MKLSCSLSLILLPLIKVSSFKVVIVGSGPAGKLSAISLAKKGYEVSLFESRSKIPPKERSFNFVLSKRGIKVLDKFDIDLREGVNIKNIISHENNINLKSQKSISIDRNDLLHSLDEKLKFYNVHTEKSLFKVVDFSNKIAYFSHGIEKYDLLIGADGSSSSVRKQLSSAYDKNILLTEEPDDRMYKTIRLDPFCLAYLPGYMNSWKDSFHTWRSKKYEIICPPTNEGGLSGVFVSSDGSFRLEEFREIYKLMRNEDIDAFNNQSPKRQKTVISSHIALDSVLLIGDACHSMLASLGQGINAALEDVLFLEHCIDLGIESVCENYDRLRLEDSIAICKLSQEAFGGKSDRTNRGNSSATLQYINDPNISYSEIYNFRNP